MKCSTVGNIGFACVSSILPNLLGGVLKKTYAVIAFTLMSSVSAQAADFVIPDLPDLPDTTFDWTGFYAGLGLGYGFGQGASTFAGNTTTIPLDGVLLGGTVGWNYQVDSFVLGVEGDVFWNNQSGSATCVGAPALSCNGMIDWNGSLRGRAGVAVDTALFYGTAGVAFAGATATVTPPAGGTTGTHSDNFVGWTAGAGAEFLVTDNLTAKVEYSYTDYGTRTAPAGTLAFGGPTTIALTSHAVKTGLNWSF